MTLPFASSDPDVVTVDQKGTVNGKNLGTATVTCTVTDTAGNTAEGSCTIIVRHSVDDLIRWIMHGLVFGLSRKN